MNKKGFTLVELLAVIVILAIIALIATPIVINVVNESREKANLRSIESYAKAYETAYYQALLTDNTVELKFGQYDSYKDVTFVWEAKGAGTYTVYNDDGAPIEITSNITGRFEPIEGKNSSYKKFVLTTDLTKVESTDNYYNLLIKISASDDKNWNYFEQYLLVQIYKNN